MSSFSFSMNQDIIDHLLDNNSIAKYTWKWQTIIHNIQKLMRNIYTYVNIATMIKIFQRPINIRKYWRLVRNSRILSPRKKLIIINISSTNHIKDQKSLRKVIDIFQSFLILGLIIFWFDTLVGIKEVLNECDNYFL
jgi:hypothetical protein